jgi:hypothetical protein
MVTNTFQLFRNLSIIPVESEVGNSLEWRRVHQAGVVITKLFIGCYIGK